MTNMVTHVVDAVVMEPARIPSLNQTAPALPGLIRQALSLPAFRAQWDDLQDTTFRAFAAAVLLFAAEDQEIGRVVERILSTRRHLLLSEVTSLPVSPGGIRLFAKVDWHNFEPDDWGGLLIGLNRPEVRRPLAHVKTITPLLARQLLRIPTELLLPRVLDVLAMLEVSHERLFLLCDAFKNCDPGRRAAVMAAIHRIDGIGAFWDCVSLCLGERTHWFHLPAAVYESDLVEPLDTAEAMISEGLRMRNCLNRLVGKVVAGRVILFRGRGALRLNTELRPAGQAWLPGRVLGANNRPVAPALESLICEDLARIAAILPPPSSAGQEESELAELRSWARHNCPRQVGRMAQALKRIHGRSRTWDNGAYTIFEAENEGYVQFMSNDDGTEYLCELSSHRYLPHIQTLLGEETVGLIERAGFLWPRGQANFIRWISVASVQGCVGLAELAAALLAKILRHPSSAPVTITIYIP